MQAVDISHVPVRIAWVLRFIQSLGFQTAVNFSPKEVVNGLNDERNDG